MSYSEGEKFKSENGSRSQNPADGRAEINVFRALKALDDAPVLARAPESGTEKNPIIDSQMTRDEAMKSVAKGCPETIKENQQLVDVKYYSFDGKVHQGQILIHKKLANDVREVFQIAFDHHFPIESVIPVSKFGWRDDASMDANNTSGFNYRTVTGGKTISNHGRGFAIDINTKLNPYIKERNVEPAGATYDPNVPGTLTADHFLVKEFKKRGWSWGGDWKNLKDYQHFEKVVAE